MANTTTSDDSSIQIVPDGSTDWLWSSDLTAKNSGIHVNSIQFVPSAAADRLIIRNGSITGVTLFDSGAVVDAGAVIRYYSGKRIRPVIDASECTFDTAASAKIMIDLV